MDFRELGEIHCGLMDEARAEVVFAENCGMNLMPSRRCHVMTSIFSIVQKSPVYMSLKRWFSDFCSNMKAFELLLKDNMACDL